MATSRFWDVFVPERPKPVIGMIHMFGENSAERLRRALSEADILRMQGVDALLFENYSGCSSAEVFESLETVRRTPSAPICGANILPNEFGISIPKTFRGGGQFVQLDHVAGTYQQGTTLPVGAYKGVRSQFPTVVVLGGVWPKYYHPVDGSNLEKDLADGVNRADAIVVTGSGTGKETPIEKIISFRNRIRDHPLVVGAGSTTDNVYEQLMVADAVIAGSFLKFNGEAYNPVDPIRVRDYMDAIRQVRQDYTKSLSSVG